MRRIVYVTIFEFIGIIVSTFILMAINQGDAKESLPVAIMVSTAAVIWNFIYTIGFEAGLFAVCLPLYMLWYDAGIWLALTMEFSILLFFLVYTFVFTLLFDHVFTRHTYEVS